MKLQVIQGKIQENSADTLIVNLFEGSNARQALQARSTGAEWRALLR